MSRIRSPIAIDVLTNRIVDTATGEILKDAIPAVIFPKKAKISREFCLFFKETPGGKMLYSSVEVTDNRKTLVQRDLTKREYDVFHSLLERLEFENWIDTTPQEIADGLGIDVSAVRKLMRSLSKKGVCHKISTTGGVLRWRMNSEICWRGSADGYARSRGTTAPVIPLQRKSKSV